MTIAPTLTRLDRFLNLFRSYNATKRQTSRTCNTPSFCVRVSKNTITELVNQLPHNGFKNILLRILSNRLRKETF